MNGIDECAWCCAYLGTVPGLAAGRVSHGICAACAAEMTRGLGLQPLPSEPPPGPPRLTARGRAILAGIELERLPGRRAPAMLRPTVAEPPRRPASRTVGLGWWCFASAAVAVALALAALTLVAAG